MSETDGTQHRDILSQISRRVMLERGLLPDFSQKALAELDTMQSPAGAESGKVRELRDLRPQLGR